MKNDEIEYGKFKIHIMHSRLDYRSEILFYTTFATIYAISKVTGQYEFTVHIDFLIYQFWLKDRIRKIIRHDEGTRIFIGDGYIDVTNYYLRYPRSKRLYIPARPPIFVIDKDEDYVLVIP